MSGVDLEYRLAASVPELRGKLKSDAPLKDFTWFRVGGPAQVLYSPADEADLAYFLRETPSDIPITLIGLGSNLLVRDGGIEGVVIRLGKGFGQIKIEDGSRLRAGAAVPDVKVARAAADAGISGLSFYRGIPGCVGGALRMNGGAHGRETKEVVIEVRAVDRKAEVHVLPVAELHYEYRHCGAPEDFIFTEALFQGEPGDPAKILAEMDDIAAYREQDGRLDLQEPFGQEGVAAHRRGRLPGPCGRRRQGLRDALQLPDQRRERERSRYRGAWRDGARAGERK